MDRQKGIAPILIIILIAVAVGGYLIFKTYLYCPSGSFRFTWGGTCNGTGLLLSSPNPDSSTKASDSAEIANWKTYTDPDKKFTFKYPQRYAIAGSTPEQVKIELTAYTGHTSYLIVSTNTSDFINSKSYKLCSQIDNNSSLCIDENSYKQKKPISMVKLDSKGAVSFYLKENKDYIYHIVQTENDPKIELKMDIADAEGLLEQDFNQILSTFKFTQ